MFRIGDYNRLEIVKEVDFGLYLNSEEGEILLPKKYVPEGTKIGDFINVFIYTDSEDRLIATTLKPHAVVDEFAVMKVKHVTGFGAFLDWGLEKDLLVPLREQHKKLEEGDMAIVRVCLDHKTNRVIGVGKINPFLNKDVSDLSEGEEVALLIYEFTDLGAMALVNEEYSGILYKNETFEDLQIGDVRKGYIKKIRPDNKIDLSLTKQGYKAVEDVTQDLFERLKNAGGFLPYHDKSDPVDIQREFKMSKKVFKKAIGGLFRQGLIQVGNDGIRITASS
ncbi:MAG: S1-like domain-containing RNA-binding protein [Bacteroidota bacterium]|nr:S1-like domain-containing RNA-binding protein [Bacteroidota bacterium]